MGRPPPPAITPLPPETLLTAALAAAIGGAINAIAGGGTLVTFPALLALGVAPVAANATSTVALWPGTMASLWGYRRAIAGAGVWARAWALPSLAGGFVGSWLLLRTPDARFAALVPWLILGATALFMAQPLVLRHLAGTGMVASIDPTREAPPTRFLLFQFLGAVYGGYFGAGLGIVMLAAMGLMGLRDIHQMNGLKNVGGGAINLVAVVLFATSGIVRWPLATVMLIGAMIGGYGGSRLAQRVGAAWVRRAVVVIGLSSAVYAFVR
ncbi:MAG: sulfite exporter TauE/SafE family protein [Gemmatimonadaceae bacterium]|nr:sulfite exporter TauE/SafE family protein [Gemmatimonadaceae bacterium]